MLAASHREAGDASDGGPECPAVRDRGLREAIVDAMDTGRCSLAQRLADAAARLPRTSPSLAAAIMRVRLRQSLPSAALAACNHASRMTPELHLLRAVAHLDMRQWLEAHIELSHAAARGALCAQGVQLLAHLECRSGDRQQMQSLLKELRSRGREREAIALLLCDAVECGEAEPARELALALHEHAALPSQRAEVESALAGMGHVRRSTQPAAGEGLIARLASELVLSPAMLNPLIEAQRRQFDGPSAQLLRDALERGLEKMIDPMTAEAAIVQLTLVLDGPAVASARLAAAIERHPMCAPLRSLQHTVERARLAARDPGRVKERGAHVLATIGGEESNIERRRGIAA